jgi:NADPH:quinone reductase-like Zn-dependent oxidoreductase
MGGFPSNITVSLDITVSLEIAVHQLKPIIDRIFPLTEAREAYHYLKSGTHFGKVVIQL